MRPIKNRKRHWHRYQRRPSTSFYNMVDEMNDIIAHLMPNVKFNNGTCRFEIDEEEDEALDFIAQQEEITMQRARENAVDSVRKSRRNKI